MSVAKIEQAFPDLSKCGYAITSEETPDYNCIAYAADDTEAWWEPDPMFLSYWPPEASREYTLEAYIEAYGLLGYVICNNADYEDGYEKIAIYVDHNEKPTHASRQLTSGKWTSKLGQLEDIQHNTLEGLYNSNYGTVKVILKRAK